VRLLPDAATYDDTPTRSLLLYLYATGSKTQAMHALFIFQAIHVSADGVFEQHTGIQMTSLGFSDKGFHAGDKGLLSLSIPSVPSISYRFLAV
jgi:hypothetical protein